MSNLLILLVCVSLAAQALAQDDDLEEATGLEPSTTSAESTPTTPPSWFSWRGYGLLDLTHIEGNRNGTYFPNMELSLTLDIKISEKFSTFTESRGVYQDSNDEFQGIFDQGGLRWRPADEWLFVAGKERNRRSPGLIISPSDFIHTNQNIPGLRDNRSGVWLGRAAWQTSSQSLEIISLPFSQTDESGFPKSNSEYAGTGVRYFARLPGGIDVEFNIGHSDEDLKIGAFAQSIVAQIWKVYIENGYDQSTRSSSQLIGINYEGSSTYTAALEYYRKDSNWNTYSPILIDDQYLILNAGAKELADNFNLNSTLITSLETGDYAHIIRGEWLVNDRNVAGVSFINIQPNKFFDWQTTIDWKYSF